MRIERREPLVVFMGAVGFLYLRRSQTEPADDDEAESTVQTGPDTSGHSVSTGA